MAQWSILAPTARRNRSAASCAMSSVISERAQVSGSETEGKETVRAGQQRWLDSSRPAHGATRPTIGNQAYEESGPSALLASIRHVRGRQGDSARRLGRIGPESGSAGELATPRARTLVPQVTCAPESACGSPRQRRSSRQNSNPHRRSDAGAAGGGGDRLDRLAYDGEDGCSVA